MGSIPTETHEMLSMNAVDRIRIKALGLSMTCKDIATLNFCSRLISEAANFEAVCIIAVNGESNSSILLGTHSRLGTIPRFDDRSVVKALLSPEGRYFCRHGYSIAKVEMLNKNSDARSVFEQGMLSPIDVVMEDSPLTTSSTFSEAPLASGVEEPRVRWRSGNPTRFGIAALTTDRKRTFGIEDLRFLQGFSVVIGTLLRQCINAGDTVQLQKPQDLEGEVKDFAESQAEALRREKQRLFVGKRAMRATQSGFSNFIRTLSRTSVRDSMSNTLIPEDLSTRSIHIRRNSMDPEQHSPAKKGKWSSPPMLRLAPEPACVEGQIPFYPMGALDGEGLRPRAPRASRAVLLPHRLSRS